MEIIRENEDDRREFTPQERAEIRRIVTAYKRSAWFWTTFGIWLKWAFWIAAGVVSLKAAIGDYMKWILR